MLIYPYLGIFVYIFTSTYWIREIFNKIKYKLNAGVAP